MDQNNQSGTINNPTPSPFPSSLNTPHEKKVGPIIAVLIIVLVLIIASLYLFASRVDEPITPSGDNYDAAGVEQSVQPVTSNSTDLADIQSDLDMSTDGIDSQNF